MSASANSHIWKKYNEPSTPEGKLAGVRGALHCGHWEQRLTQLKSECWHVPTSAPRHPYSSGKGWHFCLFLPSIRTSLYFTRQRAGSHACWRNHCWLNLLVENQPFITFLDTGTLKKTCSSVYLLLFCFKAHFYFKCRWLKKTKWFYIKSHFMKIFQYIDDSHKLIYDGKSNRFIVSFAACCMLSLSTAFILCKHEQLLKFTLLSW